MRKGFVRSVQVALVTATMLLAPATMASAAPSAGSDVIKSTDSGGFSTQANTCGFRTSAYPNSWWVASLPANRCTECPQWAAAYEATESGGPWDFYCTYNTNNGLVDLQKRYA